MFFFNDQFRNNKNYNYGDKKIERKEDFMKKLKEEEVEKKKA